MANIKSAIKRARIARKKALRNKMWKSMVRTFIRRFEESLASGDTEKARERYRLAARILDKAASKGIIHKNASSRKKSRLASKLNKALSA